MPIPDTLLTFTIVGDPYKFQAFRPNKGLVDIEGTFGEEYAGTFVCRYRNIDDRSEIENRYTLRFPGGTHGMNFRHLDMVKGLITLLQVKAKDAKTGSEGLPVWCAFDKLGTEVDEAAIITASEKYEALLNDAKKD